MKVKEERRNVRRKGLKVMYYTCCRFAVLCPWNEVRKLCNDGYGKCCVRERLMPCPSSTSRVMADEGSRECVGSKDARRQLTAEEEGG